MVNMQHGVSASIAIKNQRRKSETECVGNSYPQFDPDGLKQWKTVRRQRSKSRKVLEYEESLEESSKRPFNVFHIGVILTLLGFLFLLGSFVPVEFLVRLKGTGLLCIILGIFCFTSYAFCALVFFLQSARESWRERKAARVGNEEKTQNLIQMNSESSELNGFHESLDLGTISFNSPARNSFPCPNISIEKY